MRKITYLLVALASVFIFTSSSFGQDKSNKGKEFWLGYGHNILFTYDDGQGVNSQQLVIYLTAEQTATVTISVNGTTWSQTLTVPANSVNTTVTIPKTGVNDARLMTEGLFTKGIHIQSDVPIVAYAHQYGIMSSAATMLMPVETFGYTYYSVNFTQTTNYGNSYSWFYAVAAENNTRIQITPSDTTEGGWLPNHTYTVDLQKGEIYNVFGKNFQNLSGKDMSGSKIVSIAGADGTCHPIGVFSGSSRNVVLCPSCNGSGQYVGQYNGNGGEVMMQQIFPANAWGTKYVTYHTVNNISANITTPFLNVYRVSVRDPLTIVKKNGIVMTGLINNFYYEFSSTSGDIIEADKPVLVSQYTVSSNECVSYNSNPLGDPEMIYLSPIEQGVKSAIFYNTRKEQISLSLVNIIAPATALNSLLVDGAPFVTGEYTVHPNSNQYIVAVKKFTGPGAQHTITCDSTFVATVYGVGITESYGYNVGTLVNNLNARSEIRNVNNTNGITDTFTCPKTPLRIKVKLAYPATKISWNLSQVTGLTPSADVIDNAPIANSTLSINGRTYYEYELNQDIQLQTTGTYYVPVVYTAVDIDACNQTEQTTVKIIVKPGPISDFNISNNLCLRDTVHFTGAAIPGTFNLTAYKWDFPDNTTVNTINAVKHFMTAGNQQIRYRVYADNGCVGDTTKTIIIQDTPTALFSIDGNKCQSDSVKITDASTIGNGTINSWHWDFGNGQTEIRNNGASFYHHYPAPGNFIISLYTFSASTCGSDTFRIPVTIHAVPIAKFSFSTPVCLRENIVFSDSSYVYATNLIEWNWNFGDAQTDIRTNYNPFNHVYNLPGTYNLSLYVKNSNGCVSDSFKLTLVATAKPLATISFAGKPCIDSTITFTSSIATGSANSPIWHWDFGDGNTGSSSTNNIIQHIYSYSLNIVTVKHWVTYTGSCNSDTASISLPSISPNPIASFTISGGSYCIGTTLDFNSTLTGISNWQWDLGNTTSNQPPPLNNIYNTAGNYNIKLQVVNNAGCKSTVSNQAIRIDPKPTISAGPNKTIPSGTSTSIDATATNAGQLNFLWTPASYLNSPVILNPNSTPSVSVDYLLTATDKISGCKDTSSMKIFVVPALMIPSAFTPNGDGKNDKWDIPGLALYPKARVTIYNRAGNLIYTANGYDPNGWDGNYKGVKQPGAVYVYLIVLNDAENRVLKGTLTLIR